MISTIDELTVSNNTCYMPILSFHKQTCFPSELNFTCMIEISFSNIFVYPLIIKQSPVSFMIWSLNQIENDWPPNLCSVFSTVNPAWSKIWYVSEMVNKLSVIKKWMFITMCNQIAMGLKCSNWRIIILICCYVITL